MAVAAAQAWRARAWRTPSGPVPHPATVLYAPTWRHADDSLNVSPMGPIVGERLDHLWLRPFHTSTTYRNLKRTGRGVFHITDDELGCDWSK